jgi:hypothetical protein
MHATIIICHSSSNSRISGRPVAFALLHPQLLDALDDAMNHGHWPDLSLSGFHPTFV